MNIIFVIFVPKMFTSNTCLHYRRKLETNTFWADPISPELKWDQPLAAASYKIPINNKLIVQRRLSKYVSTSVPLAAFLSIINQKNYRTCQDLLSGLSGEMQVTYQCATMLLYLCYSHNNANSMLWSVNWRLGKYVRGWVFWTKDVVPKLTLFNFHSRSTNI